MKEMITAKVASNKRTDMNDGFWRIVSTLPEHKDVMPNVEQAMIAQAQAGNRFAHDTLVQNYMRPTLALALGVYLAQDWDCKISTEDTIQSGWCALNESVSKYNVNCGKSFWEFAKCYIFKAFRLVRRYGQSMPINDWQVKMSKAAIDANEELFNANGVQPTEEEICVKIGLKPTARNCRKVESWLLGAYDSVPVESLQSEVDDGDGNTTTLEAQVADPKSWIEEFQRKEDVERVKWLIANELSEEQRVVLTDTLNGLTQAAIGAKFGKTHGWVDKILRQTREYLKSRMAG